jgi:flagellar basal body-associated protein FliL
MWIEGHWFSKDLLSQVLLIWLLGVAVAGVFVWRLAHKKKSPAAKNQPAKRTRRPARK